MGAFLHSGHSARCASYQGRPELMRQQHRINGEKGTPTLEFGRDPWPTHLSSKSNKEGWITTATELREFKGGERRINGGRGAGGAGCRS